MVLVALGSGAVAQDWAKDVDRACTHRRYGLRLAAARKALENDPQYASAYFLIGDVLTRAAALAEDNAAFV